MSTMDIDRLKVSPLFYDALSGEFVPPGSPDYGSQTLGRLAYLSVKEGNWKPQSQSRHHYVYRPSWAASVETIAETTRVFNESTLSLSGLLLVADDARQLGIRGHQLSNGSPEYLITISNEHQEMGRFEITLGPSLIEVRSAVAGLAQEFFDRTAAA